MNMTTGPTGGYILSGIMTAEVLQYSSKCVSAEDSEGAQRDISGAMAMDTVNVQLEVAEKTEAES